MIETERTSIDCKHANQGSRRHFVSCALGLYGGTPHVSICQNCTSRSPGISSLINGVGAFQNAKSDEKPPQTLTPEKLSLAIRRADVCRECRYHRQTVLEHPGPTAFSVDCQRVPNGTVSLVNGSCPARRWTANGSSFRNIGRYGGPHASRPLVLQEYFWGIYVISLQRTPARLKQFWERFPKDWPFQNPEVFDAVDADRDRPWNGWKGGGGAYGCWRSWMAILAKYLAELPTQPPSERKPILIMEDDCEFTPSCAQRFGEFISGLPRDWEIAFPGGQHFQPAVPFAPGIVRCRETGRTHCVMINQDFAAELYCFWLRWDTHVDHGLQDWCRKSGERKFFAADPFFSIQGANWSTIRWRQEPARSWDGRVEAWHRKPADVPIVFLDESAETVRRLRDAGKIHTGYWRNEQDVDRGLVEIMSVAPDERPGKLRRWIELVRSEAAAYPEAVVAVWYPNDLMGLLDTFDAIGQTLGTLRES